MYPNLERLSLTDYGAGKWATAETSDTSFYALVTVLMRRADSDNLELLKEAFPNIYRDLVARYNAPGGILPGERE